MGLLDDREVVVGILNRLGKATRASLNELKKRNTGVPDKPLSQLSDKELEEELLRRRRDRASRRTRGDRSAKVVESPQSKQISQCYANLELEPGASIDDIRRAYRELMRKYHPDRHLDDAARHRAATELAQSLTSAYRALVEHLEK